MTSDELTDGSLPFLSSVGAKKGENKRPKKLRRVIIQLTGRTEEVRVSPKDKNSRIYTLREIIVRAKIKPTEPAGANDPKTD